MLLHCIGMVCEHYEVIVINQAMGVNMKTKVALDMMIITMMVTNYEEGVATKRMGGASEVLPLQKGGGGRKSFSHAGGGGPQKVLT